MALPLRASALAAALLFLSACSDSGREDRSDALASEGETRPTVVTTFSIVADLARNVAGEEAEIISIVPIGADVHTFQPTPPAIASIQSADLVLWNGLNLEIWFERFLEGLDAPSALVTEGIEPISIAVEGADVPNPHAWMSLSNARIYIRNIRDALIVIDPDSEAVYRSNAQSYLQEIEELDAPLRERFATLPEKRRILATSEGAFSYLARDFGLREFYIWPMNADAQGTPGQMRKMIADMRRSGAPAVFSESTVSDKPARQVARETGAAYGGILYVDSLSEPDGPVPTYLDLMKVTTGTIEKALTQ
ncbi:metal ABC transporter substrate-binding protein [Notoacmeibacter ruber]|uniref:Metal ABC transporter substrate-binding protein n=1 Tax=Notoacmeibacter ruber TaxID=2670375 RepID=A0A3L7JDA1_9HYPH|nr:metal ABC transporter substrate-binding protein [Notoacmeibacter ruber]RLQ88653.1 metal ABC transporter substrate-binding protein [Notoacmeibacter ruber]